MNPIIEPRPFEIARGFAVALLSLSALLAAPLCPRAAAGFQSQSFTFDRSNESAFDDVSSFGTVLVEANNTSGALNGLDAGSVRFTVDVTQLAVYGCLDNFGIQAFSFNSDLDLNAKGVNISVPKKWGVSFGKGGTGGFGKFDVNAKGTASTRYDPLVITVTGLGSFATIDHFLFKSDHKVEDKTAYFVAHVAGFEGKPGSHWVGVTDITPAPEPSAIVLAFGGLGSLGLVGARTFLRRRKSSS